MNDSPAEIFQNRKKKKPKPEKRLALPVGWLCSCCLLTTGSSEELGLAIGLAQDFRIPAFQRQFIGLERGRERGWDKKKSGGRGDVKMKLHWQRIMRLSNK